MPKISSVVITYNEEENINDCLESLKWTDEIIVVDSGSTDKTREIASEFTKNIIITDTLTYGKKRNIGFDNAHSEWIIWVDADERVTGELKEEILSVINSGKNSTSVYLVNRKSFFINKFIKHCGWYPDYTLRLFKSSESLRFDDASVHEKLTYSGNPGKLVNPLLHYTDRNFEHYLEKLNNYTTLSARDLFNKNKKASFFDIIFRPVFTFFKMYFLKLGILDGFTGLVLCTLSSVHVFMKYSKLYFMKSKN